MKRFLLALAVLLAPFSVHAQSTVQTTNKVVATCGTSSYTAGSMNFPTLNTSGSSCVSASVSASISAFTPTNATSNVALNATTSSQATALPTGVTQIVQNTGANAAYITFSTGAGTATTGGYLLQPGTQATFTVGASTYINYITASSTTTLSVNGGAGFAALAGGGSGGSSGGAVTVADGANVSQGSIADATVASGASGTMESYLRTIKDSAVSTTPSTVNLTQINGVTGLAGNGVTGTGSQRVTIASDNTAFTVNAAQATAANLNAQVVGATASGATLTENPLATGCRAATAAPTAVTDGQKVNMLCGAEGKQVNLPYAIKELAVRGSTGAVTNTTQTSIIASAGGSLKNYITAIQCANSGSTTSILTFTDAAATVLINPAGGGGSWTFPVPLATAAATAFQVTPGSSSTSQYCSAQGYTGL